MTAVRAFAVIASAGSVFEMNQAVIAARVEFATCHRGLKFSVFLDFLSNAPSGTFSRAYSFDHSGVSSVLENDTGLVTSPSSHTRSHPGARNYDLVFGDLHSGIVWLRSIVL